MNGSNLVQAVGVDVAGGVAIDSVRAKGLVFRDVTDKAIASGIYRGLIQGMVSDQVAKVGGNMDPSLRNVVASVVGLTLGGLVTDYFMRSSVDVKGSAQQALEMAAGGFVINKALSYK